MKHIFKRFFLIKTSIVLGFTFNAMFVNSQYVSFKRKTMPHKKNGKNKRNRKEKRRNDYSIIYV